jgi:AcrR family transcriptional regulator
VVLAAARQLRERGWSEISVRDMMSAVGMTHGGFYKQFSSKDEIAGLAADAAFDELLDWIDRAKAEEAHGVEGAVVSRLRRGCGPGGPAASSGRLGGRHG